MVLAVKSGVLKLHSREMYNTHNTNMAFIIFILWLCCVTLSISDAAQVIRQIPLETFGFIFSFEDKMREIILGTVRAGWLQMNQHIYIKETNKTHHERKSLRFSAAFNSNKV